MNKREIVTLFTLLMISVSLPAQISSAGNGNWSETSTWIGGIIPTSDDNVIVAAGDTVIVDVEASCKDISFGDDAARLGLDANLNIYGNFNRYDTSVNPFYAGGNLWSEGAKMVFAGGAEIQTINNLGTTSSSPYPFRVQELVINKTSGKFSTGGTEEGSNDFKLGIGTSLEVISGTFELGYKDDIEGRTTSGSAASPKIIIYEDGAYTMLGNYSHIRRATNTGDETSKIDSMIVYGEATLTTLSSNRINLSAINIKDGGLLLIESGWSSSGPRLNAGIITVENCGIMENIINTDIWYNTQVALLSGGEYEVTSSEPTLPVFSVNQGTVVYSRNISDSDQTITDIDYHNLEIKYANGESKKVWALSADRTVDSLATNNSAQLVLSAASAQTLTINSKLRLTSGSVDNSDANVTVAISDGAIISRATGVITDELNFNGAVDLFYTSTADTVSSGPEIPTSSGTVNNVTISGTKGVKLTRDLTVSGDLSLEKGTIFLEGYNLELGSAATIIETDSTIIQGTLDISRGLSQNTNEVFGGLGIEILAIDVAPGTVVAERNVGVAINLGKNGMSILRNFELTVQNNENLNATLVFHYNPAELNGIEKSDLVLYQLAFDGTIWEALESTVDLTEETITASGIRSFSSITCGSKPNQAPVLSSVENMVTDEDVPATVKVYATDADSDDLVYGISVDTSAIQLAYTSSDSTLLMTPVLNWNGSAEITVAASDGIDTTFTHFTLIVQPVNDAPTSFTLSSPANGATITINTDSLNHVISFSWNASSDVDDDALSYIFVPGGELASLDTTIITAEAGTSLSVADIRDLFSDSTLAGTWTVSVTDGIDTVAAENSPFMVTIKSLVNNGPVLNPIENLTIDEDSSETIIVYATDGDNDVLEYSFSADTNAISLMYKVQDSTLLITPASNWNGISEITISATDGIDTALITFTLTVQPVNDLPESFSLVLPEDESVITVKSDSLTQTITFSWNTSSDIDGDELVYIFVPGGDLADLDTTIISTELSTSLSVADLSGLLSNSSLSCIWAVFVTDGIDTVAADNNSLSFTIQINTVSVVTGLEIPDKFQLYNNYPNPFNPITQIKFGLPKSEFVEITIYNALGRRVKNLVSETKEAGYHAIQWDATDNYGRNVSNGVYFCQFVSKDFSRVIKMVYLK